MSNKKKSLGIAAATAVALALTVPLTASAAPDGQVETARPDGKPTVVLVHGAWADASSFAPVTAALQKDGYTVLNAPNPLRGLAGDAANVAAFVNQATSGPVVLVGHSYGGSVITDAAVDTPTVKALVYINAYAPDEGESVIGLTGTHPGSVLGVPDPSTVFDFVQYPGAQSGDVDTFIKPALFADVFSKSLEAEDAKVLAASQSPVALSALTAPSSAPAWKTIKSFFFVGTADSLLPAAAQLDMAERAGGEIVQYATDHLSMLEAPRKVTALIEKAARTR